MAAEDLGVRVLRAVDLGLHSEGALAQALSEDLGDVTHWVDTLVDGGLLGRQTSGLADLVITPAGSATLRERLNQIELPVGWLDLDHLPVDNKDRNELNATRADAAPHRVPADELDRNTTLEALNEAFASGQLTADELGWRSDRAMRAVTQGDLIDLVRDLGPTPADRARRRHRLILGGVLAALVPLMVAAGVMMFAADRASWLSVIVLNGSFIGTVWVLTWYGRLHPGDLYETG